MLEPSNTQLVSDLPSARRIHALILQAKKEEEDMDGSRYRDLKESIALENVYFSYDPSTPVLSRVSIQIPYGKMTAIVGESGSGKTTIVDLLLGLYEPDKGRITIDGMDLNKINLAQYRSKISYITQEPVLFNDTIRNNLLMGLGREVSDKELKAVCKKYRSEFKN